MRSKYSAWLGHPVVLEIDSGESRVPLRGRMLNESSDAVRVRLEGRWDVDIFKEMILKVEPDHFPAAGANIVRSGVEDQTACMTDSRSRLYQHWTCVLEELIQDWTSFLDGWWRNQFSKELCYKAALSAGLAGTILFLLAMQVGLTHPIGFFVRVICGFLGLVLCAISLGCVAWLLGDSAKMQTEILPYCSRVSTSFLRSLHKTIGSLL